MSRVFLWFEEWLLWYENRKDKVTSSVELIKIYNRRGVFSLADKKYTYVEKQLLEADHISLSTHRHWYQMHFNHYFSDNPVKYERKEEILKSLTTYFLLQFKEQALLYIAELHNWSEIQSYDYTNQIKVLSQMVDLVPDTRSSKVLSLVVRLVRDMDRSAFMQLKDMVLGDQLQEDSELHIIASLYMITFSLRLWNKNKISDPQLIFDVYDYGIASGVLLKTGKIPFIRFINLVSTLGFIKTASSTYAFVDRWKHLVGEESQEAITALAYAELRFYEGKLDDIIPLLIGKKFATEWGRLRASSLELVGLYADRKNNYALLVNRIKNFKRVLRTFGHKRSNLSYRSFYNFTKVLDLLVKREFIKVTIHLEKYSPIIFKQWLEKELEAGTR